MFAVTAIRGMVISSALALAACSSAIATELPANFLRDHLKNGTDGPELVIVPAGSFRMGAVHGGGDSDEKPVHGVAIAKPFAIGRYEVTFAEYDFFFEATGREKPKDGRRYFPFSNWGRGRRPAINVSWDDALAYTRWLSEQTGKQ